MLLYLDSSPSNQAAHFLSFQHLAESHVPTVPSAMLCLKVIISITHVRAGDMRFITCLPLHGLLSTLKACIGWPKKYHLSPHKRNYEIQVRSTYQIKKKLTSVFYYF